MSTLRPACGSPRPPRPRRDPRTHQQVTGRPPRHPDHPPNDPEPTTTTKPHPQVLTIAPGGGGTTYPNTSHQKRATRSGSAQSKVTWNSRIGNCNQRGHVDALHFEVLRVHVVCLSPTALDRDLILVPLVRAGSRL